MRDLANVPLFEFRGKTYGAVLDINAIDRIQAKYTMFDKWRFLALGSNAIPTPREEDTRSLCLFLSDLWEQPGEISQMNVEPAKQTVEELREIHRLPIEIKENSGGATIAPHKLITDIAFSQKPIERIETEMSLYHLLKGVKFMVDEYVRIHNADLYGASPLPWLSEKELGELQAADLVDIAIEAMMNSFSRRKDDNNVGCFEFKPVDTSFIYMLAMSEWNFSEETVRRLTLKRFDEFFETYKALRLPQK
jgi:hypothetical protein